MSDPRDRSNLAVDCLIHDLNNVFQTVIDAAELIASDPKWAAAAATIVRGVERGRRIVASLAEADRPVCVRALVESAAVFAKDFAAAIGGPELRFAIDVEADVILTVRRSAVERALMNLFINSAQAAHAAGARTCSISVSAVRDGGSVALTISDDGPGRPAAARAWACTLWKARSLRAGVRFRRATATPEALFSLFAFRLAPTPPPARKSPFRIEKSEIFQRACIYLSRQ